MPETMARRSIDNTVLIATQMTATCPRIKPSRQPFAPESGHARIEGSSVPAPTVTALLALNADLVARNFALLAALDRQVGTARPRLARKEDVITEPVSDGAILHFASARRSDSKERDAGSLAASLLSSLTPRQIQILHLILAGHPSKNIAADLSISQRTVENHRAAIMRRTGATSLPALARMAVGADGSGDHNPVSSRGRVADARH